MKRFPQIKNKKAHQNTKVQAKKQRTRKAREKKPKPRTQAKIFGLLPDTTTTKADFIYGKHTALVIHVHRFTTDALLATVPERGNPSFIDIIIPSFSCLEQWASLCLGYFYTDTPNLT